MSDSSLLTLDQAAEHLAVSRSLFAHNWRSVWQIPVVRLGPQTLRWRRQDLDAFTDKRSRRMVA